MSRRAGRQSDVSVTLFPFLAVLICTMGSLIVLLVVVVQQASKAPAAAVAAAQPLPNEIPEDTRQHQQLKNKRDDLTWQSEMLSGSREATLQRLKEQQVDLSRAEDQARRLKEKLDELLSTITSVGKRTSTARVESRSGGSKTTTAQAGNRRS